jgi:hypothetical protein
MLISSALVDVHSMLRFPNGSMRLVMVTVIGAVLGFFIGISFPSVSITKVLMIVTST